MEEREEHSDGVSTRPLAAGVAVVGAGRGSAFGDTGVWPTVARTLARPTDRKLPKSGSSAENDRRLNFGTPLGLYQRGGLHRRPLRAAVGRFG
jgi:hypothetical protein